MEKNLHDCCGAIEKEEEQINKNLIGLKEEILKELKREKQGKKRKFNWASVTVTAVFGILMVVSLAQAVEIISIWKKIQNGAVSAATAARPAASAPTSSAIESLPNMVGGC